MAESSKKVCMAQDGVRGIFMMLKVSPQSEVMLHTFVT